MTATLLIARHGNTFGPDDTPTRVGAHTDLPLVEKGREQARKLGRYLKDNNLVPDVIFTSNLKRTIEMAELAIAEIGFDIPCRALPIFNEIDYGPDENKTEAEVIARIGEAAIKAWDNSGAVPDGWLANPNEIIENWQNFANELEDGTRTLVITSNGIARFALYLQAAAKPAPPAEHSLKISTGALCILERSTDWAIKGWNIKP